MSQAAADRNLLFGILALQMDFISRDALIAAMHAWVLDKAKPLGQVLMEQGALAAADRELLESVVQRHLQKHGYDAERSLAALAAPQTVQDELRRLADPQLTAGLAQIPTTPSAVHDALATTAGASADAARFQILRPHARGGLGEVFVAKDAELNREVALKEIQPQHADHPESRARFVREAEITGGLEHPGIVPVYALGQYADGRPYYAMRFIKGDSLKQAIEHFHASALSQTQRNLELRQLLNRFIAVCNAIAFAHSRGVIHRDLKPSNIMLGEFGETLVVDWGLAKAMGHGQETEGKEAHLERTTDPVLSPTDSELTRTGQALGTPAYMSPEQAAGRHAQLGPASDVYSLGATLYTLLTGQAPFGKSDVGEVLKKVQTGDFALPRQVNAQVPAALEAICLKAMALEPRDRYPSAKALADDLEHWLADEGVTAHAEAWPARLARWARHHRGMVGSAISVLTVGLTVAIATGLVKEATDRHKKEQELRGIAEDQKSEAEKQRGIAEEQRREAVKPRQLANRYLYCSRINLAHHAWQEADIARMDELLEQTKPEYTGGEDLRGFEYGYLMRLRQSSLLTLKGHTSVVYGVAFSPDGQLLASAGGDSMVKIWNARTGRAIRTLKGHTGSVSSVAFSPDGRRLASLSGIGEMKVWDDRTGQKILSFKTDIGGTVAFSPDGQRLASVGLDGRVKLWDAYTGRETLTFKGSPKAGGFSHAVAFSPDGQRLASDSPSNAVKVWDVHKGQEILALKNHGPGGIQSIAFSPDGQRLASDDLDGMVKIWNAHMGNEILSFKGHSNTVKSVAFSPDGQRLATASKDQTVKVWDLRTGQEILTLKGHTGSVTSVMFSPDGERLSSASEDGMVKIWDARAVQEALTVNKHVGQDVFEVAFSPDGQRLASVGWDNTVNVWDTRTGNEILTLKGHTKRVTSVAFSPDGQLLASASEDQTVKVWNARTGQESLTLEGQTSHVRIVAFSPNGQRLLFASEDGLIKIWDARTGQEILTLKGHTQAVNTVAFSLDGQLLASAGSDRSVKIWDTRTVKELLTLKGHNNVVISVAFSPDGQRLASASLDGMVKIWDARSGQEVSTVKKHLGAVRRVAFSPDGQRLASVGWDNTVNVCDAITGQEILTLKKHTYSRSINSVAFSPDGQRLASAGADGMVKIWDATPLSEGSNLQRQAISYFRFVAETVVLKDDMIQKIRQTPTLNEPARELALTFTKDYREFPDQLNDASWSVVRGSWARPGAYALALRQAEASRPYEPGSGLFLSTLGAAQYRNRQYAAALKTLVESVKRGGIDPYDLAFLAMTQFQLGRKADAVATLGRLRDTMKKLPFDREAEDLLQEAERVVEAKK